ncbi:MAG: GntR family transcriptional regulator [Clostridia bacterium]|nr:GntR family transcriptional regulator [Clostridia bacterium]
MRVSERYPGESAREYAYRMIKDNIVSMELEPGSYIAEKDIALAIGVSRTPVSVAANELARTRILDVVAQRGLLISLIDYDMIDEAVFFRSTMEKAIVELACEYVEKADIDELHRIVSLQQYHLDHDRSDLMQLDCDFHQRLYRIARKEGLYPIVDQMTIHFDRVRAESMRVVKDMKIVLDHAQLVDALAARDIAGALEITRRHLSRYKVDAAAIQAAYPDWVRGRT